MNGDHAELSVERFYSEAKNSGKILGLYCEKGHCTVPPRETCRICFSKNLEIKPVSSFGSIVSYSKVYAKSAAFPLDVPYILALVRLEEGGSLLGILESDRSKFDSERVRITFKSFPKDIQSRTRIFFEIV